MQSISLDRIRLSNNTYHRPLEADTATSTNSDESGEEYNVVDPIYPETVCIDCIDELMSKLSINEQEAKAL